MTTYFFGEGGAPITWDMIHLFLDPNYQGSAHYMPNQIPFNYHPTYVSPQNPQSNLRPMIIPNLIRPISVSNLIRPVSVPNIIRPLSVPNIIRPVSVPNSDNPQPVHYIPQNQYWPNHYQFFPSHPIANSYRPSYIPSSIANNVLPQSYANVSASQLTGAPLITNSHIVATRATLPSPQSENCFIPIDVPRSPNVISTSTTTNTSSIASASRTSTSPLVPAPRIDLDATFLRPVFSNRFSPIVENWPYDPPEILTSSSDENDMSHLEGAVGGTIEYYYVPCEVCLNEELYSNQSLDEPMGLANIEWCKKEFNVTEIPSNSFSYDGTRCRFLKPGQKPEDIQDETSEESDASGGYDEYEEARYIRRRGVHLDYSNPIAYFKELALLHLDPSSLCVAIHGICGTVATDFYFTASLYGESFPKGSMPRRCILSLDGRYHPDDRVKLKIWENHSDEVADVVENILDADSDYDRDCYMYRLLSFPAAGDFVNFGESQVSLNLEKRDVGPCWKSDTEDIVRSVWTKKPENENASMSICAFMFKHRIPIIFDAKWDDLGSLMEPLSLKEK